MFSIAEQIINEIITEGSSKNYNDSSSNLNVDSFMSNSAKAFVNYCEFISLR